ncbi:MAG TPA: hypothetical protein VGT41_03575 [Candidatus Babeliales bacterium]|nr:hypothetical protein [Candidatus Babeliales bacterium]
MPLLSLLNLQHAVAQGLYKVEQREASVRVKDVAIDEDEKIASDGSGYRHASSVLQTERIVSKFLLGKMLDNQELM